MLARPTLQQEVLDFSRAAFAAIATTGILALEAVEAEEPEQDAGV